MTGRALALVPSGAPTDPLANTDDAEANALDAQAAAHDALARALRAQAAAVRARRAAPPASSALSPLRTPSECAAALGLSIATLNRRVNEGTIPFVQIGDSRRYDLDAVRAALSALRTRALPAPDSGPELPAAPAPAGVRRVSVGGKRRGAR